MVPSDLHLLKKQPRQEKAVLNCHTILRTSPSLREGSFDEASGTPVDMLQIVFISPDRFSGLHRVEICVSKDDEEDIRTWLKHHMPIFWKL